VIHAPSNGIELDRLSSFVILRLCIFELKYRTCTRRGR
jgi:hypothetical protein